MGDSHNYSYKRRVFKGDDRVSFRPLLFIAENIYKQDQEAHRRMRKRKWLESHPWYVYIYFPSILIAIGFLIYLTLSDMARPLAIAIPVTLPVLAFGTVVAWRQAYLNQTCQIADDKRKIRLQTIDHLRETVGVFRNDEQQFTADLLDLYRLGAVPSRVEAFRDSIELRAAKRGVGSSVVAMELSEGYRLEAIEALHGRPRICQCVIELMVEYYPLFSFAWGHLMYHEMLGMGLARKSFGIRTIDGISGPQVVDTFTHWWPFIREVRRMPGYGRSFTQFQWLVSSIVALRAARSAAKYYDIPIATSPPPDESNERWLQMLRDSRYSVTLNRAYYRPRGTSALGPIVTALAESNSARRAELRAECNELVHKAVSAGLE